ncbi:hypothetical protein CL689_07130 [Candidatus Saccharibacteria bacterium]|nr:hypothetical protein [Candidatus Saccharibacteria bacterium]
MRLEIENSFLKDFASTFENLTDKPWAIHLERSSAWGNDSKVNFELSSVSTEDLSSMYELAKAKGNRSVMVNLTGVLAARKSKGQTKLSKLRMLDEAIRSFISADFIDGWLYHQGADGLMQPYAFESVRYEPPKLRDTESVTVSLFCCAPKEKGGRHNESAFTRVYLNFRTDDLNLGSVAQIFQSKGYSHETPDLKEAYLQSRNRLVEVVSQPYKQYWVKGSVMTSMELWSRKKVEIPFPTRAVFDEYHVFRTIIESFVPGDTRGYDGSVTLDNLVTVPLSMYTSIFDMDRHQYFWAHVDLLEDYAFDEGMVDKIVLPETHRDLIGILTQDLDIQFEDIVKGKSGGTTILCKGAPGLGKTLTAEVFSESVRRPLYRVHSGQIGYDPEHVESNLREILVRAQRWGAALLIDEADVFIRERSNDIVHNAIVSAFLRTLEYFSGLLFLTTNRSNDIDDAILSRCTAIVKYEYPDKEQAVRLWQVLSKQSGVKLSPALCKKLADLFSKDVSGRDIKKLIDLTARYADKKKLALDVDLFRRCALFKGMI